MQGQSESQDSIVGLVAKAAATTGGGSRSEDFSPTALKTADQQDFSFVAASGCYPVATKRSVPLREGSSSILRVLDLPVARSICTRHWV